jgi:hypothetical protein
MEENRSRNTVIFPYIILAVVFVSTALILFQLWSSVIPVVVHPTEGPTPTYTLWWRTPQTATSTSTPAALSASFSRAGVTTPIPASGFDLEIQDD